MPGVSTYLLPAARRSGKSLPILALAPGAIALALFIPVIFKALRGSLRMDQLAPLRRSIVGSPRKRIESMLGPPRADGGGAVWYYPVNEAEKLAMAISFEGDRARSVEFFYSPQ